MPGLVRCRHLRVIVQELLDCVLSTDEPWLIPKTEEWRLLELYTAVQLSFGFEVQFRETDLFRQSIVGDGESDTRVQILAVALLANVHILRGAWIQLLGSVRANAARRLAHFTDNQLPMDMDRVSLLVGPQCASSFWTYQYEFLGNFDTICSRDGMLPLDAMEVHEPPEDGDEYDDLFEQTLPPLQHNVYDREQGCLPFVEKKCIGRGSFGSVYKVKVAGNHFLDSGHAGGRTLAMSQTRAQHQHELDILMELIRRASMARAIVSVSAAGFSAMTTAIHMYPVAECDLHQYMTEQQPNGPELQGRLEILQQMRGLADSVKYLHSSLERSGNSRSCSHLDFRPENILVHNRGADGWHFKITDFDISRCKVTGDWKPPPLAPLDIHTLGIDCPNLPPDVLDLAHDTCKPSAATRADVWSLGIVFSECLAWMSGGRESLEAFESARFEADLDQLSFQVDQGHITIKPSVVSYFKELIQATGPVDERRLIRRCWTLLESKMLMCDPLLRASMSQVVDGLSRIIEEENDRGSTRGDEDFWSPEVGGSCGLRNDWYPYATSPGVCEQYNTTVSLRVPGGHAVKTNAQIDTGASHCYINEELASSLQLLTTDLSSPLKIQLAEGSNFDARKQVHVDLSFVGRSAEYACQLLQVKNLQHRIVFGRDFIQQHSLVLPNAMKWLPSPIPPNGRSAHGSLHVAEVDRK